MDPAEVFGETLWFWLRRVLLMGSALALGGTLGNLAESEAPLDLFDHVCDGFAWTVGWAFTSIAPLVIGVFIVFILSSRSVAWWWFAVVVMVSAQEVFGEHGGVEGDQAAVWLILLGFVAAGLRYLQLQRQRAWENELASLHGENSWRRAQDDAGE